MNTSKNTSLSLNGVQLNNVTDIGYSVESSLFPQYINSRLSNTFTPTNYVKGALTFSYLLDGVDPIIENIGSYNAIYYGNMAGVSFTTGYLTNYSLSIKQNAPISASATIITYDAIGSLTESAINSAATGYLLHSSDIIIQDYSGVSINALNPQEITFSYSNDVSPVNVAGTTRPRSFSFGAASAQIDILTDSRTGTQNISGEYTKFDIEMYDNVGNEMNILTIEGVVHRKNLSFRTSDYANNLYSITQNKVLSSFNITGLSPSSGYCGEIISIGSGANFNSITHYILNGKLYDNISIYNNNASFPVPCDNTSGRICFYGANTECFDFNVLDSGIRVSGFSPISGSYYDSRYNYVDILGSGFHYVDSVSFGVAQAAKLDVMDDNTIRAYVPARATWDKLLIRSSSRSKSATTLQKFIPIPYPLSYNATANFFSQVCHFIGDHFSGVTGISFNGLPTSSTYTTAGQDGITGISCVIPSGNTRGYLNFYSQSGVAALSNFQFDPTIYYFGITQTKSRTGVYLGITGLYLIPELMASGTGVTPVIPNSYYIKIGTGSATNFIRDSHTFMSGLISADSSTGPLRILANDGSEYPWTGVYVIQPGPPEITLVAPDNIYYPGETRIYGNNLFNVTSVEYYQGTGIPTTGVISGYTVAYDGHQIGIPSTGMQADYKPGFGYSHRYGFVVKTEQGTATSGSACTINDYAVSDCLANRDIYFSGFYSGQIGYQISSGYTDNFTSYDNTTRFPATPDINWYSNPAVWAYGVGRDYRSYKNTSGYIDLSINDASQAITQTLIGSFKGDNGCSQSFNIYLRPSNNLIYTNGTYAPLSNASFGDNGWKVNGVYEAGYTLDSSGPPYSVGVYTTITSIRMDWNNVTNLNDGVFNFSPIAETIEYLGINNITNSPLTLPILNSLTHLELFNCTIGGVTPSIDATVCPNLEELLLINNDITTVTANSLASLVICDLTNSLVTSININGCSALKYFVAYSALDVTMVDYILTTIETFGTSGGGSRSVETAFNGGGPTSYTLGTIDLTFSCAAPSVIGQAAKIALQGRGWTVQTN